MRRFHTIAVLKGGPSAERSVSLSSGTAVAKALRSLDYDVVEVDVTGYDVEVPSTCEAVFIALHGAFGEDGQLQKMLEQRKIPFTGSSSSASRCSFDKLSSKRVFEANGVATPRWEVLLPGQPRTLPLPVVVKPPRQGSSIGISKVFQESEWEPALQAAREHDPESLVEAYIEGRELTVGIVGDQVLPVVEIRAPDGYYDYHAKYTKGVTEYLAPAPLDDDTTRMCQALAWRSFTALNARGLGRVDIRLTPDGHPFVLELNNIPGFTETSLLPKAARVVGLEFPALCEKILNLARYE